MIILIVSKVRGVDEGTLAKIVLLMLEVLGISVGNVIPREVLKVVGVGGNVNVGAHVGEGMEDKRIARENIYKSPTATPATEKLTVLKEATRRATVVARSAT